jgi:transposase InsO family protein
MLVLGPVNSIFDFLTFASSLARARAGGGVSPTAADITYIPMARGFLYLVVVMDWYSRYVLAWRLSNTMDTSF